jgi:hypothetical protein
MSRLELEETWMPDMVEGLRTSMCSVQLSVTSFVGTPVPSAPSPTCKLWTVKLCTVGTQ